MSRLYLGPIRETPWWEKRDNAVVAGTAEAEAREKAAALMKSLLQGGFDAAPREEIEGLAECLQTISKYRE
jgi:hypothetical protein